MGKEGQENVKIYFKNSTPFMDYPVRKHPGPTENRLFPVVSRGSKRFLECFISLLRVSGGFRSTVGVHRRSGGISWYILGFSGFMASEGGFGGFPGRSTSVPGDCRPFQRF